MAGCPSLFLRVRFPGHAVIPSAAKNPSLSCIFLPPCKSASCLILGAGLL
jgi:hypothetical protein